MMCQADPMHLVNLRNWTGFDDVGCAGEERAYAVGGEEQTWGRKQMERVMRRRTKNQPVRCFVIR